MAKLIIFGKGKMAELANFYFTHDSLHEVIAFCLDDNYIEDKYYLGLPMIPFSMIQEFYPPDEYLMFIAIGYKKMNSIRAEKYREAKLKGYTLASYISSRTSNWGVEVGENTFIMDNNVIMPFCKIGNNVTVWISNMLSHHSEIGDHTTITSHVAFGGNVKVSLGCFFGMNSTIRDGINIGQNCLISAATNIVKDTEANGVYFGNPGRASGKKSFEIDF